MAKWNFDRWIQIYIALLTTAGVYLNYASRPSNSPVANAPPGAIMTTQHVAWLMIATGVVLTLINYQLKRHGASNVESPLIRLPNGYLAWKELRLKQVANKAFLNDTVVLDGTRFINCSFEHSTMVYDGSASTDVVDCRVIRHAGQTNLTLRTSNPIVMAAFQIQAKLSDGKAPVGFRFEPHDE
jgi:hypothetical protein